MSRITINGISLDPVADAPQLMHQATQVAEAAPSNYILVQAKAPLTADQKAQLRRQGVQPLEYVPNDTYVCKYGGRLSEIQALPFVAWANPYLRGFKIAPSLHAAAQGPRARLVDLHGPAASPRAGSQLVDVVLHRDVDPAAVAQRISVAAGIDPRDLKPAHGKFRVRVAADRLGALAALDEVRHVEPVLEKKLWNNVARGLLGVDDVQNQTSLEGDGQIVAVCDTGFDKGSADHPHPAFTGRVLKLYTLGRPGKADDPDGHGTHVCGSVLGDGVSKILGPVRGTAPKAKLIMQSVLDPQGNLGGLPDDLHQLLQPPYDDGARVHSNSWGDNNNAYPAESHDVDSFVWDNRDLVVVIAAGNEGVDHNGDGVVDPHSVGSPGTAKNCITIGASENHRPGFAYVDGHFRITSYGQGWPQDFPAPPIREDKLADNPNGLAAFSSRGPTADGRIKPDLVAPGTGILSTRSREEGVGNGWGLSEDPLYFYDGGTSMATPLVAGCAAVVRQYLLSVDVETPSAALVKAMLINGAEAMPGQYTPSETGTIPNSHQGFGIVNLAAAVNADPKSKLLKFWDEDKALDTGEEQLCNVDLQAPAKAVKVTLVWTDPPGEALQNDLDLIVSAAGVTTLGNAAPGSNVPDRTNNVEQAILTGVPAGPITIKVTAFRAAIEPQSFALVVRAIA